MLCNGKHRGYVARILRAETCCLRIGRTFAGNAAGSGKEKSGGRLFQYVYQRISY